ncbi:MAG TPA: methionyl-tRNA formyltransferase [Candidatus Gracilibacteria bacterium]|nr:methionyl-tRNA formyltransferase [Candidatus Gracilibacteria bacterium]HPO05892.1 methionyl-tRNA formyltransferase [Candidatus Gracilibacteria bacterium]
MAKSEQFQVVEVLTQGDKPVGRKQIMTPSPVKLCAQKYNLPLWQGEKLKEKLADFQSLKADFLVVIAYGKIIPQSILDCFSYTINLHGSILPKYRGASPIQMAVLNGNLETGVSVMQMVKAMDAGPVYEIHKMPILAEDSSADIFQKMGDLAAQNLLTDLINIANGKMPVAQEENQATYCEKISKEDGLLDFSKYTALECLNRLRAFTPWPGVYFEYESLPIKVLSAQILKNPLVTSFAKSGFLTKDHTYFLPLTIVPAGKKAMNFADWAREK